jgi:hypothetical protein
MTEKNDRIRMSWDKKVSLREIAQFYEEKLRDLDAKQQSMFSVLENRQIILSEKIEREIVNLQGKVEAAANVLSASFDLKEVIEKERRDYWEAVVSNLRRHIERGLSEQRETIESEYKELEKLALFEAPSKARTLIEIDTLIVFVLKLLAKQDKGLLIESLSNFNSLTPDEVVSFWHVGGYIKTDPRIENDEVLSIQRKVASIYINDWKEKIKLALEDKFFSNGSREVL